MERKSFREEKVSAMAYFARMYLDNLRQGLGELMENEEFARRLNDLCAYVDGLLIDSSDDDIEDMYMVVKYRKIN